MTSEAFSRNIYSCYSFLINEGIERRWLGKIWRDVGRLIICISYINYKDAQTVINSYCYYSFRFHSSSLLFGAALLNAEYFKYAFSIEILSMSI